MSFSSEVKKELCSVNAVDTEQKRQSFTAYLFSLRYLKKIKLFLQPKTVMFLKSDGFA